MFVIGLTGGIGSGKSTVAHLFSKKGITVIDTDILARDVMLPGSDALSKIIEKFGTSDRSTLREMVFNDDEKRHWLENLLHPLIIENMHQKIAQSLSPYCMVILPLLFETGPYPILNRILVIDTTENQQIERTVQRDHMLKDTVQKILKTQVSREYRLQHADDIIQNTGSLKDLEHQVENLHKKYILLSN